MTFIPTFMGLGVLIMAIVFFGGFQGVRPRSSPANLTSMSSVYSPTVQHWSNSVESWATEYDLDPNLVATVMQIESCGDPAALSSAGAAGLFQVMPFHFASGEDPSDPNTNALRGLSYLKLSLDTAQGDVRLALAGYNGGIGVISQPEGYWPAETRRYADWGSRIYDEAARGENTSQTLQEWMAHGGSNLCRTASERLWIWSYNSN